MTLLVLLFYLLFIYGLEWGDMLLLFWVLMFSYALCCLAFYRYFYYFYILFNS